MYWTDVISIQTYTTMRNICFKLVKLETLHFKFDIYTSMQWSVWVEIEWKINVSQSKSTQAYISTCVDVSSKVEIKMGICVRNLLIWHLAFEWFRIIQDVLSIGISISWIAKAQLDFQGWIITFSICSICCYFKVLDLVWLMLFWN